MTVAIQACGVHKRFATTIAVSDVSFSVEPGEVFALLGPNGAGKTTTVRMIATLLRPSAGELFVCGIRAGGDEDPRIRKQIGLLTESPGLYDRLGAADNLDYAGRLYGVPDGERPRRIAAWLERLGLAGRTEMVANFSKGMRQKLAIARALLHEPPVLLLDEPTSGLDPESSAAVREIIRGLAAEGRAILLCTHRLDEVEKLCRRAAVMDEGRIAAVVDVAGGRPPVKVSLAAPPSEALLAAARAVPGVQAVWAADDGGLEVALAPGADAVPELIAALVAAGARVRSVAERSNRLEEVYLSLMKASV